MSAKQHKLIKPGDDVTGTRQWQAPVVEGRDTYSGHWRWRGSQVLREETFAKLEMELDLTSPDEKLRGGLNHLVSNYLGAFQRRPAKAAALNEQLDAIKRAARELHERLNEDPVEAAARATMAATFYELCDKLGTRGATAEQ